MKATVIKQTGGKSIVAVTAIKDIALVLCTSIENVDYEEMRGAQGEYTAFYQAESLGEYENEQAMEIALEHKMWIDLPYLLMSSKPFGNWMTYLFHSPPTM